MSNCPFFPSFFCCCCRRSYLSEKGKSSLGVIVFCVCVITITPARIRQDVVDVSRQISATKHNQWRAKSVVLHQCSWVEANGQGMRCVKLRISLTMEIAQILKRGESWKWVVLVRCNILDSSNARYILCEFLCMVKFLFWVCSRLIVG